MTQPYSIARPSEERSGILPFLLKADYGWSPAFSAYTPEEYFCAHPEAYYWMTGSADGVTFHSRDSPALDRFFSLEEIREAASDFHFDHHRSLMRHLFKMWD